MEGNHSDLGARSSLVLVAYMRNDIVPFSLVTGLAF